MKNWIKKILRKVKRLIRKSLKKVYTLIFCDPYHRIKNRYQKRKKTQILHHVYDARELFYQENDITGFNRYDMIVRLLAIENYYGKNDFGWDLYRKQQSTRKAEDWQNAEPRFRALIKSYKENGYDESSEIRIGADLRLWDGSHRMALAMYHKHYSISCQVMPSSRPIYYGINWYHENGFTLEEIGKIHNRYLRLKEDIRVPFICTLWAPVSPYYDDITDRLKRICDVESYKDYTFDEFTYAQMARKIYAVDDIEQWKIEKKIEYMHQNVLDGKWKMRVVKLRLDSPRFRRKDSTQNTLSQECENIKRIIRNCYKDRLPNYFHDIICHIGDNFYQNEFIDKLFQYHELDIEAVLKNIKPFQYVLTKTDVPYMPSDFPKNYPLGKDMDLVCIKSDFSGVCNAIINSLQDMQLPYTIREVGKSEYHKLIRVELEEYLIYQFDITSELLVPNADFIPQMLKRRIQEQNYYKPFLKDELIIRLYEAVYNKQKRHHIEFLQNHLTELDSNCEKFLNAEVSEVLKMFREPANASQCVRGGRIRHKLDLAIIELKIDMWQNAIPLNEICVVGSSILAIYGMRENHDVDFVMASKYRERFASSGVVPFSEYVEMVSQNWARSKNRNTINDDELIQNPEYHFTYQGVKFAMLPLLLERKEWQGREKDLQDIKLINQYMQSSKS